MIRRRNEPQRELVDIQVEEEGKQISSYSKYFTSNGIRQIVNDGSDIKGHYDGVKQAECRTEIQY